MVAIREAHGILRDSSQPRQRLAAFTGYSAKGEGAPPGSSEVPPAHQRCARGARFLIIRLSSSGIRLSLRVTM